MNPRTLLRRRTDCTQTASRKSQRNQALRTLPSQLRLESLESRQLLAVLTFTNGTTFDNALSADRASVYLGTPFEAAATEAGLATDQTHALAYLTGVSANPGTAVALGDPISGSGATVRAGIRVYWGDKHLKDQSGNDFVVSEIGSGGSPEAYGVAVKPVGADFTNFVYRKARDTSPNGNSGPAAFLTNFDLAADFGLPAGTEVEELRIVNLIATDRVTGTGEGAVYYDASSVPTTGPLGAAGDVAFATGSFDADPSYVFAVSPSNLVALPQNTFVNDNWALITDNAPAGLAGGDVVRNDSDFTDPTTISGTYLTTAFGSIPQANYNFDSGNDAGWTRYSPFTPFGAPSTFSFPSSTQGGLGYRFQSPASPSPATLGGARSAAVLPTSYSDFRITTDVVDWSSASDQAFGLLARAKEVGLGGTDGYLFVYDARYGGHMYLARVDNEVPSTINSIPTGPLIVGHDYRMVMNGVGSVLTGELIDLTTGTQVTIITGVDTAYASGVVGLISAIDSDTPTGSADVTFDNFVAESGGTRINSAIGSTAAGGNVRVLEGLYNESVDVSHPVTLSGDIVTIGALSTSATGATISPGVAGPGAISTGNLSLSTGAIYKVELNGNASAGVDYDQLSVTGTVNLGGATLSASRGFSPSPGQSFIIISNDGADAVTGTFANLAEGATVTLGGIPFEVSYHGGVGGNDVTLTVPNTFVAQRQVFYNNSKFDGQNPAINASDAAAIAIGKSALLPGGTASYANYTSSSAGINGVMIDVYNLPAGTLTASDFVFRVGNDSTPAGWGLGPAPTAINVVAGSPGNPSRITLTWADGAIKNQWLQVTVNANANTGLLQSDVFYFGNAVGETGNSVTDAQVNGVDEVATRNHPQTFLSPATAANAYDFNHDGYVNATDQILARSNSTTLASALQLIAVPSSLSALGAASASPSDLQSTSNIAAGIVAASAPASAQSLAPLGSTTFVGPLPAATLSTAATAVGVNSAAADLLWAAGTHQSDSSDDSDLFELLADDVLAGG